MTDYYTLPARITDRPSFGHSVLHFGTCHDRLGEDAWVAELLEQMGWDVAWSYRTVDARERLDGKPHPKAGETVASARCVPPGYRADQDPVLAATARAVERTGNSDGAGRGGQMGVTGTVHRNMASVNRARTGGVIGAGR